MAILSLQPFARDNEVRAISIGFKYSPVLIRRRVVGKYIHGVPAVENNGKTPCCADLNLLNDKLARLALK